MVNVDKQKIKQLGNHITDSAIVINVDGIKKLIMHILLRAQQDFISYRMFSNELDAEIYHSAEKLIFDDNFAIEVGNGEEITINELCGIIGGSIRDLRKQTIDLINSGVYDLEDYIVE